ncbi:unnamed protein product [Caenorhabditis nigoni]
MELNNNSSFLMKVESLRTLAENRLAKNLFEYGFNGWRIGDKIPPLSSNSIFDELCYRRVGDHMVPEMMRRLEVTKAILSQSDCNQNICNFLKEQNLEKLLLLRWPRGDVFYLEPYVLENGEEEFRMNIIVSLKKLLGPGSQKQLKTLHIAPDICRFIPDWVRPLGELLPSLTCLCLEGIHIGNEFVDLCETCPNLNKLNISNSGVNNLTGISKMPNLEVLIISNLRIDNKEAIQEIFDLKKLRVLDMGTCRAPQGLYSNNLKHYLSCGQTHNELRFIDVYGNYVGNSDFETLVETHPMLVKIGLINTPLERQPPMKFTQPPSSNEQRTIELLTIQTMQCCLSALENYVGPRMAREKHPLLCIFREIRRQLTSSSPDPDEKDVGDCFRSMLELLTLKCNKSLLKKEKHKSTILTINLLNLLTREPRYAPYWYKEGQLYTAAALFRFVVYCNIEKESMNSFEYNLKCAAWTFFTTIIGRSNVLNQDLEKLCKEAVKEIAELTNMQSPLFQLLLHFLLRAVRKMTPEMTPLATVQSVILGKLTDKFSGSRMEGLSPNVMKKFIDIVYELVRLGRHQPNWDHSLQKKSIRVIAEFMIEWGNRPFRNILLGKLERFLKYMPSTVCRVFFESRIRLLLRELMIHVDTRRAAISLLIKVYMFKEIRTYVTFVSAIPKYNVLIDEMMKVFDGVENYTDADAYDAHFRRWEETGQYTNAFTFCYWLQAQWAQDGVSITWPEIEYAPRPKRRRIDN